MIRTKQILAMVADRLNWNPFLFGLGGQDYADFSLCLDNFILPFERISPSFAAYNFSTCRRPIYGYAVIVPSGPHTTQIYAVTVLNVNSFSQP